jgi:hypothetical protein
MAVDPPRRFAATARFFGRPCPCTLWLDLSKNAKINSVVVAAAKGRASFPVQVGACRGSACAILVNFVAPLPDGLI